MVISVLIAGSRNPRNPFAARITVAEIIAKLPLGMVVLNGGAHGIDQYVLDELHKQPQGQVVDLGVHWHAPDKHRLPVDKVTAVVYRARWKRDGKAAGILRNLHMLDLQPEMVVVLWNGLSPGSRQVYEEAGRRGLERVLIET